MKFYADLTTQKPRTFASGKPLLAPWHHIPTKASSYIAYALYGICQTVEQICAGYSISEMQGKTLAQQDALKQWQQQKLILIEQDSGPLLLKPLRLTVNYLSSYFTTPAINLAPTPKAEPVAAPTTIAVVTENHQEASPAATPQFAGETAIRKRVKKEPIADDAKEAPVVDEAKEAPQASAPKKRAKRKTPDTLTN